VAPTTACDTGVTPHQCVQCLSDAGCLLPQVCSPTTHACVECTPTNTTACVPSGSGVHCLSGGTCGCQSDTDCGGVTSGHICDATVHKCTIGCRATGGNGCPVGLTCSSADATAGHCGPPVDGGTDGSSGDGSIADGTGADGRDVASDGIITDGPGTDRLADGNASEGGSRDGTSADGADGRDAIVGRDGAGADGSGQLSDGRNDQAFGDAAIGTRVLNLAGGGCQCGIGPTIATTGWQATSAAFSLLALTLIARRRRRRR
jgi:MYXO-CTERM domain-containing protein